VEPTVHTTSPKVDKENTSLVEAPTAQALVVRSGSKVLDGSPTDGHSDLLNFITVESGITCWLSSLLQMY
jgi:hypothetical protein